MRLNREILLKLAKQIPRSHRRGMVGVLLGAMATALLNFGGIAMLLYIIMVAILDDNYNQYLWLISLAGIIILAAKNLLTIAIGRHRSRTFQSLYSHYTTTILEGYYREGLLTIRRRGVASLIHDVRSITGHYVSNFINAFITLICEGVLFTLIVIAMAIYSPTALLCSLGIFLPVCAIYIFAVTKSIKTKGQENNEIAREHYLTMDNIFRGYAELEINQSYGVMRERFQLEIESINRNSITLATLNRLPNLLLEVALATLIFILISSTQGGNMDELKILLGVLGVVALRVMPGIKMILGAINTINNTNYTLDVIMSIKPASEQPAEATESEPLTCRESIEVRKVSFRYEADQPLVLRDLSLDIRVGEFVGLYGESGGGKSTIFNIMQGFFTPLSGGVYIDGRELTSANRPSWHRQIGYVPQEVFIMSGSILENITFGTAAEEVDRSRVAEILRQTSLEAWVAGFDDGADHKITGYGTTISGGQRQRIGVARALYKGARILFFDEATSSLDPTTEMSILESLQKLRESDPTFTMIIIAHRRSTIEICDRVVEIKRLDGDDETI